jgi:hypothetical protein
VRSSASTMFDTSTSVDQAGLCPRSMCTRSVKVRCPNNAPTKSTWTATERREDFRGVRRWISRFVAAPGRLLERDARAAGSQAHPAGHRAVARPRHARRPGRVARTRRARSARRRRRRTRGSARPGHPVLLQPGRTAVRRRRGVPRLGGARRGGVARDVPGQRRAAAGAFHRRGRPSNLRLSWSAAWDAVARCSPRQDGGGHRLAIQRSDASRSTSSQTLWRTFERWARPALPHAVGGAVTSYRWVHAAAVAAG